MKNPFGRLISRAALRPAVPRLMRQVTQLQTALGNLAKLVPPPAMMGEAATAPAPAVPEAGFTEGVFTCAAGSRPYHLYAPPKVTAAHPMLVVMLHGCTQTAEEFAVATGMNRVAAARGFMVLYPEQIARANGQRCWNWFQPGDQTRDSGEAAVIAGMTRLVMGQHAIDPARVYVAGLSAGGAMAAILGAAYPDLFAAIGVHSGLACGAAGDIAQALSAMAKGRDGVGHHVIPAIVFHGDQDRTVALRNAEAVIAQTTLGDARSIETGHVAGGHGYTRTVFDRSELWVVQGLGHAWSGGHAGARFTDSHGPDASAEMIRFFEAQART